MESDLRAFVADSMRQHPRVAYQGLLTEPETTTRIVAALPALLSFRKAYAGAIAIIDWDHKLPSDCLFLRIFGFYTEASLEAGHAAFDDRIDEIAARDRYPEFDVPDFEGIAADEAYEIEIGLDGTVGRCRLTSPWRRTIAPADAKRAIAIVESSSEYRRLVAASPQRPGYLGELEAVSWTPPCEGEHARWTIDVWFLMAFDGRIGSGRSFLVDIENTALVAARDFSVRAG